MPGVYVGETKSLVFPILSDGYILQRYANTNAPNVSLALRGGHWGITKGFTIEMIITPYDCNGFGSKTTGSGITDSEKTMPSLNTSVTSNTTHYQSNQYTSNRYAHKMMLYYNKNFELYLENTTNTNINQPAEYRIVAKINQSDTTKVTATSDTVIKPNNVLHGYYDSNESNSLYEGITTSLRQLDSSTSLNSSTRVISQMTTSETNLIGVGESIYGNTGKLIGTVTSINANDITLSSSNFTAANYTTDIFYSQPREALFVDSTYKVSCSFTGDSLKIYLNNIEIAAQTVTNLTDGFYFDPSDTWIGKGKVRDTQVIGGTTVYAYTENKNTQFMGEMYEICMHGRKEPSARNSTLSVGYNDIIFYYRFRDK